MRSRTYNQRSPLTCKRLQFGDSSPFDFFKTPDMKIEVLGPLVKQVDAKPALRFLGDPPAGPRIGHDSMDVEPLDAKGLSASHTINGHSIVFKLSYRGFSYLFCGDLNDEASRFLARNHNDGTVTCVRRSSRCRTMDPPTSRAASSRRSRRWSAW
jgi:hypothetical protein